MYEDMLKFAVTFFTDFSEQLAKTCTYRTDAFTIALNIL